MTVAIKFFVLALLVSAIFNISCSVPTLEDPNCSSAGNAVREFYSLHFGNDIKPTTEDLQARRRHLTEELFTSLSDMSPGDIDYFTATSDYPKAFRVGACRSASATDAVVEVLLFWRDDNRSEQRSVDVEVKRDGSQWLINKVSPS